MEDKKTASLVTELIAGTGGNTSRVARASDVPRSWFYKARAGKISAQVDTLEKVGVTQGKTLAWVPNSRALGHVFAADVAPFESLRVTTALAIEEAERNLPETIEADCEVKRLGLSFAEVSTLVDDTTIGGAPLEVWEATRMVAAAKKAIAEAKTGRPSPLVYVGMDGTVAADEALPSVRREMQFFCQAVFLGADIAQMAYSVSSHLLVQGLPWLAPGYKQVEEFRRAVYMLRCLGDPSQILRVLFDSAKERREHNEQDWWWAGQ